MYVYTPPTTERAAGVNFNLNKLRVPQVKIQRMSQIFYKFSVDHPCIRSPWVGVGIIKVISDKMYLFKSKVGRSLGAHLIVSGISVP
jgi:hypothetical protein